MKGLVIYRYDSEPLRDYMAAQEFNEEQIKTLGIATYDFIVHFPSCSTLIVRGTVCQKKTN